MADFLNGGFETGDFTNWANGEGAGSPTLNAVNGTNPYSGSYAWSYDSGVQNTEGEGVKVCKTQTVDFTGMNYLRVFVDITTFSLSGVNGDCRFSVIDDTTEDYLINITATTSGYEAQTVDISSYEGSRLVRLEFNALKGYGDAGSSQIAGYIDQIQLLESLVSAPTAAFHADKTIGFYPVTIQFTDDSADTPTSWDWDFGDGSDHATSQNPSHEYTAAGTYTVTLTATNAEGSDGETKTDYIYINTPAPASIRYTLIGGFNRGI